VRRLLVAACVVPSSPIFVTLMKEAPGSTETSVLTRATKRNIPEDTILHSHRREILKSYVWEYDSAVPEGTRSSPGRRPGRFSASISRGTYLSSPPPTPPVGADLGLAQNQFR
jgi:hypothetical protein